MTSTVCAHFSLKTYEQSLLLSYISRHPLVGKKIVEVPGFEPGAFRMQSECDTTTPRPQVYLSTPASSFNAGPTHALFADLTS